MLSRSFDHYVILSGAHQITEIIPPVPLESIFTGRTGGAGDGIHYMRVLADGSQAFDPAPGPQFVEIFIFTEPKGDGADGSMRLILNPNGKIGAVDAIPIDKAQFERHDQFILRIPF